MDLQNVIYSGPPIDDAEILACAPPELVAVLERCNGFVQFDGGLHVRGACRGPQWHSLRSAWLGADAFCNLYDAVLPSDVPFAEDAVGDQFLLRDGVVHCLAAETGEIGSLDVTLEAFLEEAQANPIDVLQLQPLLQYLDEAPRPRPGQLLHVYPPFCTKEAEDGVSLRAVDTLERRRSLAAFARQVAPLPSGTPVSLRSR